MSNYDSNYSYQCCPYCEENITKNQYNGHWINDLGDDEEDIFQCSKCNKFKQGEQFKFGIYIDNKHGKGKAEKLSILAKMECKRGWFDYMQIGNEILEDVKKNKFEIK